MPTGGECQETCGCHGGSRLLPGVLPSFLSPSGRVRPYLGGRSVARGCMKLEQMGKYGVPAKMGRGSVGEFKRAHAPFRTGLVAIKTIPASLGADEEIRKRFLREAQSAARLN